MPESVIHHNFDLRGRFAERLRAFYLSDALLWGLVALGFVLRLRWYLFNRSLWFDEASVALDILYKDLPSLLRELDEIQPVPAPIGFLLAARVLTSIFGDSEQVLRLLPFLCGIAALPLFLRVAKQYVSPAVVPLAATFFSISPSLIYYSAECKPYMSDVALTLLVLWAAAWILERGLTTRSAWAFGLLGGVAVWCSFPIAFVLAGVGVAVALDCVLERDWPRLRVLATVGGGWSVSFAVYYVASLEALGGNAVLKEFWSELFLSFSDLTRTRRVFTMAFIYPLDLISSRGWLLAPIFLIGCVAHLARHRTLGLALWLPIFVTVLASCLGLYPFFGRLILFAVPLFLLATMEGLGQVVTWMRKIQPSVGIAIAVVLVGALSLPSLTIIARGPREVSEVRPLFAYIGQHAAPDDTIYVGELDLVYEYYRPRFGLADRPYVRGRHFDYLWSAADVQTLDALRGRRRVWVVTGTGEPTEYLDRIARRVESMSRAGATLVLYDLSE